MLKQFLLGATTFVLVFGWKITEVADLVLLASLALILARFWFGYMFIERTSLKIFGWLGILCLYSMIVVLLHGLMDTQIAMRSARALINYLGAAALTSFYYELAGKKFFSLLVRDIFFVLAVHALLMLAMYLDPEWRHHVYALTRAHSYVNLTSPFLDGLRISGLTYGLSQTSVLQMAGLFLFPSVFSGCNGIASRLLAVFSALLLVISVLISGRSGLMMLLLFVPLYIAATGIHTALRVSSSRAFVMIFRHFFMVIMFVAAVFSLDFLLPEKFSQYTLTQSGEVFSALTLAGPTVANLSEMIVLPDSWLEFFVGSSNLGRGSLDNIPSDVGWIKTLFAIGVTGTLLMIVPYFIALRLSWNSFVSGNVTAIACFVIFLSSVILNFKELALLTRNQWSVHALLISALALHSWSDAPGNGEKL